jgi:hypothetical protein
MQPKTKRPTHSCGNRAMPENQNIRNMATPTQNPIHMGQLKK